jgi:hypothetical protein
MTENGSQDENYDNVDFVVQGETISSSVTFDYDGGKLLDNATAGALMAAAGTDGIPDATLIRYNDWVYLYRNDVPDAPNGEPKYHFKPLAPEDDEDFELLKNYTLTKFASGGLADFTGPAWLDGTPSKPEYILNSAQTERFFSLIDVLENYKNDEKTSKSSGDNYFDINIQVEKLENDYDVEQIADKIRRMIYDDASYRNVNAINHIR